MAEQIVNKRCCKCNSIKPTSEFYKRNSSKDGYRSPCKKCCLESTKKYRREHSAEYLEYNKKYQQEHLAQFSRYTKKYRQKHSAEYSRYIKKWNREHHVELLGYYKKYRSSLNGHLRGIWNNMLNRCNNPKNKRYKNYGGRGIEVKFACFEDFFSYVTKELKADSRGLTVDRIDNNGHYEPGNIRFVTRAENNRNTFIRHDKSGRFATIN